MPAEQTPLRNTAHGEQVAQGSKCVKMAERVVDRHVAGSETWHFIRSKCAGVAFTCVGKLHIQLAVKVFSA